MSVWEDLIIAYRAYADKTDQLKLASLAQWILESARGSSALAQQHLNFAGLKFRDRMKTFAAPIAYTGTDGETTSYCKFDSVSSFIRGYWHFITSPGSPYDRWASFSNDATGYITYIAQAGYSPLGSYPTDVRNCFAEAAKLLALPKQPLGPGQAAGSNSPSAGITVVKPSWHDELHATFLNKRDTPIQGIVLHDTAGTGSHSDTQYLAKPGDGRKVSVDFTVEKDGSIWKLNPHLRSYYCNHAGRNTEWLGFKNAQVNAVTIGIEIVQSERLDSPPYYPDLQVKAVGMLCAWLCFAFSFNNSRITTHRQIITDGSRSDPRQFPFDDFWSAFWTALGKGGNFSASMTGTTVDDDIGDLPDDDY